MTATSSRCHVDRVRRYHGPYYSSPRATPPAPPPRTAAERLMEMVLSEIRAGVLTLSSGSGPFRVVA